MELSVEALTNFTNVVVALDEGLSLEEEVRKQMTEEIGTDTLNRDDERLLRQKYGLLPVQLTNKERRVVERSGRKRGR